MTNTTLETNGWQVGDRVTTGDFQGQERDGEIVNFMADSLNGKTLAIIELDDSPVGAVNQIRHTETL